jgi:2-hydroxychromene-2-carboxylate isomerase
VDGENMHFQISTQQNVRGSVRIYVEKESFSQTSHIILRSTWQEIQLKDDVF